MVSTTTLFTALAALASLAAASSPAQRSVEGELSFLEARTAERHSGSAMFRRAADGNLMLRRQVGVRKSVRDLVEPRKCYHSCWKKEKKDKKKGGRRSKKAASKKVKAKKPKKEKEEEEEDDE